MPEIDNQQTVGEYDFYNRQMEKYGYRLVYNGAILQLESTQHAYKPLYIDFISGKSRHRRLFGGGRNQPLARAVGVKGGYLPDVLDLTAGLGRDAFVLATIGCNVRMLERSKVVAALLKNAIMRATADNELNPIIQRMQLIQADSRSYLQNISADQIPAVIYMDPMYPHQDKSALVKKEMRIFRDIVGDDSDSDMLLLLARQHVKKRVVVKRPKGSDNLGGIKPHSVINSKNTRYDIYLPKQGKTGSQSG